MIAALLASMALALDVPVCAEYTLDFDDWQSTDSFWPTGTTTAEARGIRMKVIRTSNLNVMWEGYTDDTGGSAGCHTVTGLTSGQQYTIYVYSYASVEGNVINVWDDDTTPTHYSDSLNFAPTTTATQTITISDTQAWQVSASAGWAMHRFDGGMNNTYDIYNGSCCSNDPSTGNIYAGSRRKFITGHELGHRMLRFLDGDVAPQFDYDASRTGCAQYTVTQGEHELFSKEYQSASFVEGFATFYSAVVWNLVNQADCWYNKHYSLDANLDDGIDYVQYEAMTCSDDPCDGGNCTHSTNYQDDRDWLQDLIVADDDDYDGTQCVGPMIHYSSEFDWLRLGWSMIQNGLTVSEVWTLADEADPRNWDPNAGTGTTSDDPVVRFADAASSLGSPWSTTWASVKDNVDH